MAQIIQALEKKSIYGLFINVQSSHIIIGLIVVLFCFVLFSIWLRLAPISKHLLFEWKYEL